MSGASTAAGVAGVRLAPASCPRGGGNPGSRRRAAVAIVLLGIAVVAALVATRTIRLPGVRLATALLVRRASPRAAEDVVRRARPRAQAPAAPEARTSIEARSPPDPRPDPGARAMPDRVVAPTDAAALFAQHSWYVPPPPARAAPPPPPPQPTAPPFPYTFLGSYAPGNDPPVFFLSRGDRVIDARVGDRLDGVYKFESATGNELVFVYLPLDVRQNLAARVPP